MALIAAQAVALAIAAVVRHESAVLLVVPAITLVAPAIAGALPQRSRRASAASSAAALLTQAIFAIAVFGEAVRANVLMLAVLCVVALYEVGVVLLATFVVGTASVAVIAAAFPHLLGLEGTASSIVVTTMATGAIATAVGAAAVATLWDGHRHTRHVAAEQRRITSAYLDVAETLIIVLDRAGLVTTAGRFTARILGRERADIEGQDWFELAVPAEHRDESRARYGAAYDHWDVDGRLGPGTLEYENEIVTASGERRQVIWWATVVTDLAGRPARMVCSGTDVTERRAIQAALEQSKAELEGLRHLAQQVASIDDSRQAIVDATIGLTGATLASIMEPDRTRGRIGVTTSTRPELVGHTIELGREVALAANAFLGNEPQFAAEVEGAPGVNQRLAAAMGAVSVVHQPISGPDGTIGVLTVAWDHLVPSLKERKAELVGLIAHEAAVALRRREALAQLERAALVDPLTGVANRRAFDAELPLALRRADEATYPLGLVILDLNDFKAVNDEQGHEAGDYVLIGSAAAWAGVLRAGDLLARLGGDEFAVLLPRCDELEMRHIVERLRSATPHARGASIGSATWDGQEPSASLIRRADRDQYTDKARIKAAASRA